MCQFQFSSENPQNPIRGGYLFHAFILTLPIVTTLHINIFHEQAFLKEEVGILASSASIHADIQWHLQIAFMVSPRVLSK